VRDVLLDQGGMQGVRFMADQAITPWRRPDEHSQSGSAYDFEQIV
jgi:hypothetical protein